MILLLVIISDVSVIVNCKSKFGTIDNNGSKLIIFYGKIYIYLKARLQNGEQFVSFLNVIHSSQYFRTLKINHIGEFVRGNA